MPHSMLVSKLMIRPAEWPLLRADASVRDAIKILRIITEEKKLQQGHSTPIVLDENQDLIGFVHLSDLLKTIRPLCDKPDQPCDIDRATTSVRNLAVAFAGSVGPNDPILKALDIMMDQGVSLVPVIEDHKLLGVVKLSDIFTTVASLLFDQEIIDEKETLIKRFHL